MFFFFNLYKRKQQKHLWYDYDNIYLPQGPLLLSSSPIPRADKKEERWHIGTITNNLRLPMYRTGSEWQGFGSRAGREKGVWLGNEIITIIRTFNKFIILWNKSNDGILITWQETNWRNCPETKEVLLEERFQKTVAFEQKYLFYYYYDHNNYNYNTMFHPVSFSVVLILSFKFVFIRKFVNQPTISNQNDDPPSLVSILNWISFSHILLLYLHIVELWICYIIYFLVPHSMSFVGYFRIR